MATARKLEQAPADPLSRGAVKPAPPISLKPGGSCANGAGSPTRSSSMPTVSSGAISATTPSPWPAGTPLAPAGRPRGSPASGSGSWTLTQARERAMARVDHARAAFTVRCAIYTRKSSDEGLEQEFNSLDAQREACEAYIVSQCHAGWVALADMYDDGGLSGGTMERPALKRLLEDIQAGKVQIVVVYEREIAGERIRDKIAASKRKGMWMGGNVPLGYDVKDRKL